MSSPIIIAPYDPFDHAEGQITYEEAEAMAKDFFDKFSKCKQPISITLKIRGLKCTQPEQLTRWIEENKKARNEKALSSDELTEILLDPEIDFIWVVRALRGKYDEKDIAAAKKANELMRTKGALFKPDAAYIAKPMIGFCGSLSAMLPLEDLGLVVPIHGPFGTGSYIKKEEADLFRDLFFSWKSGASVQTKGICAMNKSAESMTVCDGYVYGGLVHFVYAALKQATSDHKDLILFVEAPECADVKQACEDLLALVRETKITLRAFLLGDFGRNVTQKDVELVCSEADQHGIPVFAGLSIGHLNFSSNVPIPFGCAKLHKNDHGEWELTYDLGQTQAMLKEKRDHNLAKISNA